MPARSSTGKSGGMGLVEKLKGQRPSMRTPKKRTRNVGSRQMQHSSGMIVTMSVEQSGGIAINTAEGVATSHTRQVSTTSTLFSPMGVSIGVVCESTTQNKEVIMDCIKDNGVSAIDWNEGSKHKLSTLEFRKIVSFLDDQQFQILCELNVKNVEQLLNMSLRKLLEMNLRNDQLQSLVIMLKTKICEGLKPYDLSNKNIRTLKNIEEELEKLDANDDDDEQPLVIDESIIEESNISTVSERSLDAIEDNFSKIKNIKIPQTQTALKNVKSELTEIIAELSGKENRLLSQLKKKKQTETMKIDDAKMSVGNNNEEIVTTTSQALPTNLANNIEHKQIDLAYSDKLVKPPRRAKGQRTLKRRRNLKNHSKLKTSNPVTTPNTDENNTFDMSSDINATSSNIESQTPLILNSTSDTSALDIITQSSTLDETSADSVDKLPLLDSTTTKNSIFTRSRGVLVIHPSSVVIVHDDVAKASDLMDYPIMTKPIKKRPQRRQINITTSTKNSVLLDVSESKFITAMPEQHLSTSNVTEFSATPLIQSGTDEIKALPSKEIAIDKQLKLIPAVSTQTKLQPTVLLKKLSTPIKAKEYNVDADSTTTSVDHNIMCATTNKVNTIEGIAVETSLCTQLGPIIEANKTNQVHVQQSEKKHYFSDISDDVDEHFEAYTTNDLGVAKKCEYSECEPASDMEDIASDELKYDEPTKSVTPESLLFETTKIEPDELEESGRISDQNISSIKHNIKEKDSPSNSHKLMEDVSNEESKKQSHSFVNSTPKENFKDLRTQLSAQRRIEFDSKLKHKIKTDYDSYDADAIVTFANTPLSPISSGIASPINTKICFGDYRNTMEIDACCAGVIYMLKKIDMPRIVANKPDNLDSLLRKNPSDPRLFKYTKKNTIQASSALCVYKPVSQNDPRRSSLYNTESFLKPRPQPNTPQQTPNMLLYGCLQRSPWYQSLMSTMKIQINQTISVLVRAINNFQKIRLEDPFAVFDIFKLDCAGELLEIMENLGLFVDVNGVIAEKKNMSTFAGRSYGCSSVVNATYSFIQPVVEPSTVTVQHQQVRSFTAPTQSFAPASATLPSPRTQFVSCYIDSPQVVIERPVQYEQQQQLQQPNQYQSQQYQQQTYIPQNYQQQQPRQYRPQFKPNQQYQQQQSRPDKRPRGPFPPGPRRHCGLKVPYSYNTPEDGSSVSPVKRQARFADSPPPSHSSISPVKRQAKFGNSPSPSRSSVSPLKHKPKYSGNSPSARSSLSPVKQQPIRSDSSPLARSSVSPVKRQARCSDSEGESWDVDEI